MQQQNTDEAALKIQNVYADLLPADLKGIYNTICNTTGTTGIEGTTDATAADTDGTGSEDGTDSGDSAEGDASSDSVEMEVMTMVPMTVGNMMMVLPIILMVIRSADDGSYDTGDYDDSGY